ncbi:MAG: hypothetical protein H0X04_00125 [Chthoniobacterales bacterium]|nr:hypothetical protein [Chthoniobacterales bacterium]
MAHKHRKGAASILTLPVKLTSTVPTNDITNGVLCALVSNKLVPVDKFPLDTNEATTQTAFAAAFAGLAAGNSYAASTDARQLEIAVLDDGDVEFDVASAVYHVGDYIGPSLTGSFLTNAMEAVASKALAVAVVSEEPTGTVTKVVARLINTPCKR